MKQFKNALATGILGLAVLTAGCGSRYHMLVEQRGSEAMALKLLVQKQNITAPEAAVADSLMAAGESLRAKGRMSEAYGRLDYAVVFYQLAMARHSLELAADRNRELETSLTVARSKIATYEKMLEELRAREDAEENE